MLFGGTGGGWGDLTQLDAHGGGWMGAAAAQSTRTHTGEWNSRKEEDEHDTK